MAAMNVNFTASPFKFSLLALTPFFVFEFFDCGYLLLWKNAQIANDIRHFKHNLWLPLVTK